MIVKAFFHFHGHETRFQKKNYFMLTVPFFSSGLLSPSLLESRSKAESRSNI